MNKEFNDFVEHFKEELNKRKLSLPNLVDLQAEAKKVFENRISQLLTKNEVIRKIRVSRRGINWRYLASAPFIYGMIFPSIIWHLGLEIYHQICFRLYGIPLVNYREYFIYDRQLLSWLNPWEKINCIYCSYVNNLVRYSSEIGGRTERYWCPIKYYRRISHAHSQYSKFVEGSDPTKLRKKWHELRSFSDIS